jgi:hypothetical protein
LAGDVIRIPTRQARATAAVEYVQPIEDRADQVEHCVQLLGLGVSRRATFRRVSGTTAIGRFGEQL